MIHSLALLLQQEPTPEQVAAASGVGIVAMIVSLAFILLMVASMWKVFQKAGEPGWAAVVPIYNLIVLLKIAGKPAWWLVLMLVPFVNLVVAIIVVFALAKNFGKGAGFGLGLLFLGPVFYPILAWGDARYQPQP